MFRRLAEAFETSSDVQSQYLQQQNKYYNALPNIIPSAIPVTNFSQAINTVDPHLGVNMKSAIPSPDNIIIPTGSNRLDNLSRKCESSSIDDLMRSQNTTEPIRCGWLYTPPLDGSPYPQLSKGFLGTANGPLQDFNPPAYRKWFFNLGEAKKAQLTDICKNLKSCDDVDNPVYSGLCGYCTDMGQGIPIDGSGRPLYADSPITNCGSNSIVTNKAACPKPEPAMGPQPIVDRTCEPINGQLSAVCLQRTLISGGCSDKGALALALSGGNSTPDNYIGDLRSADSTKLYNKVAKEPLNVDVFSQGRVAVLTALQEARTLAANANNNSIGTALGASARELCLQKGSIDQFDFCAELPDSTKPPYNDNIACLQNFFRKIGGHPNGLIYPSPKNITMYNNIGSLGAVKQLWSGLIEKMRSTDYAVQRDALQKMRGIVPEALIPRAPLTNGVEVMWFYLGHPTRLPIFVRRTIEADFPNFRRGDRGVIPQIGAAEYGAFAALTDIRPPSDMVVGFNVVSDDGFHILINKSIDFYKKAQNIQFEESPGVFIANKLQAATAYVSKNVNTPLYSKKANVTTVAWHDLGGGVHTFQLNMNGFAAQNTPISIKPNMYSLTLEPRAPFLNFEVNNSSTTFEDTRLPTVFNRYVASKDLEYHVRPEERDGVPGSKGFVRINNAKSFIDFTNIQFQSWKTFTMAFRIKTMPVKDSLISVWSGKWFTQIFMTPAGGNMIQLNTPQASVPYTLKLDEWYLMALNIEDRRRLNVSIGEIEAMRASGNSSGFNMNMNITGTGDVIDPKAVYDSGAGSMCSIHIGGYPTRLSGFNTASCQFDVAWAHFFDHSLDNNDIAKECNAAWVFTAPTLMP